MPLTIDKTPAIHHCVRRKIESNKGYSILYDSPLININHKSYFCSFNHYFSNFIRLLQEVS